MDWLACCCTVTACRAISTARSTSSSSQRIRVRRSCLCLCLLSFVICVFFAVAVVVVVVVVTGLSLRCAQASRGLTPCLPLISLVIYRDFLCESCSQFDPLPVIYYLTATSLPRHHLHASAPAPYFLLDLSIHLRICIVNSGESLALVSLTMMRLLGVASVRSYDGAHKLITRAAGRTTAGPRVYALHLSGRMSALGLGTPRSCTSAVKVRVHLYVVCFFPLFFSLCSFIFSLCFFPFIFSVRLRQPQLLKQVAERGPWAEELDAARDAIDEGELNEALRRYLPLAQLGSASAQANAAWLLSALALSGSNAAAAAASGVRSLGAAEASTGAAQRQRDGGGARAEHPAWILAISSLAALSRASSRAAGWFPLMRRHASYRVDPVRSAGLSRFAFSFYESAYDQGATECLLPMGDMQYVATTLRLYSSLPRLVRGSPSSCAACAVCRVFTAVGTPVGPSPFFATLCVPCTSLTPPPIHPSISLPLSPTNYCSTFDSCPLNYFLSTQFLSNRLLFNHLSN